MIGMQAIADRLRAETPPDLHAKTAHEPPRWGRPREGVVNPD